MTRLVRIAAVAGCIMMAAPALLAQGKPKAQMPQGPGPNEQFSPVYIQQMFDTMAIMEAERFLPLTPEQYPGFVQRLRRLQDARTQGHRRRGRVMNELRSLVGPQAPADVPDSAVEAKLKELAAADAEGYAGIHKAIDDLDVGLTARQRARFRMLEENVERRKIDFLTKVRGGGRGGFEGIPR